MNTLECGACGVTEDIGEDMPDSSSVYVEEALIKLGSGLNEEFLNPPHPLCRSCFIGWIHNILPMDN